MKKKSAEDRESSREGSKTEEGVRPALFMTGEEQEKRVPKKKEKVPLGQGGERETQVF